MSAGADYWMYLVDDDILSTVMSIDPTVPKTAGRPLTCHELVDAISLHLCGKSADAIAMLRQAITAREATGGPVLTDLYSTLGQIQFEAQQVDDATATFRYLVEREPEHPTAAYNLGVCLESAGQWAEACECFEAALERPLAQADARLGAAICRLHLGEPQPALAGFEACLKALPGNEAALFGRAVALQQLRRYDEAAEAYGQVLSRDPGAPEVHNNMIALGLACDDFGLVQEHSARLLALRRHSQPALEGMLAAALARADWEEAARYSTDLLKAAPDSYEGWFNRGVALQKLARTVEAAAAYQKASELCPDQAAPFVNRAAILAESDDETAARQCFEQAVSLTPEMPQLQWNLAVVALRLGETGVAQSLIEEVVAQWPEMEEAWFQLGWIRMERQHWLEAAAAFEQALARRPDWPEVTLNLALARWQSRDTAGATACFEQLGDRSDYSASAWSGLCALAIEVEDLERAENWYARLEPTGEAAPELTYNVARLRHLAGRVEQAVPLYRKTLESAPRMVEALLNLGAALESLGEHQQARECWSRSRELNPELAREYAPA